MTQVPTVTLPTEQLPPAPPALRSGVRRVLLDSGYALGSFPLAVPAFVLAVTLVSLGLGLSILVGGILILSLAAMVARGFARFERFRQETMLGRTAPMPAYLCSRPEDGFLRRTLTPLRDPQSWLDLVWCVVGLVTGTFAFVLTVAWWAVIGNGLTYWFWQRWLPQGEESGLAELLGFGDSVVTESLLQLTFGLIALVTLPWVMRFAATVHAGLARFILSGRAALQGEVARVTGSRDAARVAEAESLRRLERDIHDGPQQRLVRLTMDLGRARRQLERDPSQAAGTLDGALRQARETVDELRSLSRGIAPPLLVDRGLAAAVAEMAAGGPIPVDSTVDLPALPPHVETAAYFVVAEALTNVAKHSGARTARLDMRMVDGSVVVEVTDDGIGGAHPGKGLGLAGLAQRVRAVEGTLDVDSPVGGPTVVRASIPVETA